MRPTVLLIAALVPFLTSCVDTKTQYHSGVEPVSPVPITIFVAPHPSPNHAITKVDSLQPTLSWKCEDSSKMKFDVIVYTGVWTAPGFFQPGVEVYYREGIEGFSHHVEQRLEPNSVYVWSVRTHTGTNVESWSTFDFQRGNTWMSGNPLSGQSWGVAQAGQNLWWSFRTPRE